MYYVIETDYYDRFDSRYFSITSEPGATDRDDNPVTEGEFGNMLGVYREAHGEYETLEEAREAVKELCGGEMRDTDEYGARFEGIYENEVETYKPGKYQPMNAEGTGNWFAETRLDDFITAHTTDEEIEEIFEQFDEEVKEAVGSTLDRREGLAYMKRYRDRLLEEERDGSQ